MKNIITLILLLHCIAGANAQWIAKSSGNTSGVTHCLLETPSGVLLSGGNVGSIFSSTDDGDSWAPSNTGIRTGTEILCLGKNSAGIFAASDTIYFSNNNGTSWTIVNKNSKEIWTFAFLHDTIFASSLLGGVIMSPNNGTTWTSASNGLPPTDAIYYFISKGNLLFASTVLNRIYKSSNSGASWTPVNSGLPASTNFSLSTDGTSLYAGTSSGVYISSNDGLSWTLLSVAPVYHITFVGNGALGVDSNIKVVHSTNSAVSWTNLTSNIDTACPYGIATFYEKGQYVFCGVEGTCSGSVYRIDRNQVVSVRELQLGDIASVSPNPFSNTLRLNLNHIKHGTIEIQNTLGEKVFQSAITEQTSVFNLDNLPPGIYILTIETEKNIITRKIIKQ